MGIQIACHALQLQEDELVCLLLQTVHGTRCSRQYAEGERKRETQSLVCTASWFTLPHVLYKYSRASRRSVRARRHCLRLRAAALLAGCTRACSVCMYSIVQYSACTRGPDDDQAGRRRRGRPDGYWQSSRCSANRPPLRRHSPAMEHNNVLSRKANAFAALDQTHRCSAPIPAAAQRDE